MNPASAAMVSDSNRTSSTLRILLKPISPKAQPLPKIARKIRLSPVSRPRATSPTTPITGGYMPKISSTNAPLMPGRIIAQMAIMPQMNR